MQQKASSNIFKIIIFLFLLTSCNQSKKSSSLDEKNNLITTIIKHLATDDFPQLKKDYLINPHIGRFEFNSFSNRNYKNYHSDGKKSAVFQLLKMNEDDFVKLQKKMNSTSFDKDLVEYSTGFKSDVIITFSRISNKLVFVEVFDMCDLYSKDDLLKSNVTENPKQEVYSFSIVLENDQIIKNYIDNIVSLELQCGKQSYTD